MALDDELEKRRKWVADNMPAAELRQIADEIDRLRMLQVAETSLQPGDMFPDFTLPDTSGVMHSSDQLLARGPLVVVFFRGAWCPYCDLAFGEVERVRPEIEQAGGLVVGICPDRAEVLHQSAEVERGARYLLLSDHQNAVAKLCGLRWEASAEHAAFLERFGVDLPTRHDSGEWSLPVPASYVVDRDGLVRYAYANADWGYRAAPAALIKVLRELAHVAG